MCQNINLGQNLKSVVSGNYSLKEINAVIRLAAQMASIRLAQLIKKNKIYFDIQPHSINAVALDCIAELFKSNDERTFPELEIYFSGEFDLKTLGEEEITIAFRRLIFSKLKDGIFRIYREHDPILSKILRNIKLHVKRSDSIKTWERFGETYLIKSNNEDSNEDFPPMERDEICVHLFAELQGNESIGEQVITLINIIEKLENNRRFISLTETAIIIKEISLKTYRDIKQTSGEINEFLTTDLKATLDDVMTEIEAQIERMYLSKNKIDESTLENYKSAIKELLHNTYIMNDGVDLSYHDYVMKYDSTLSYEDYRKIHRTRFEYIAKQAKQIFVNRIKDEL